MPPHYYYHVKFELYPSPLTPSQALTQNIYLGKQREVYVPPRDSNIFETETWPSHSIVKSAKRESLAPSEKKYTLSIHKLAQNEVIDCGSSRGIHTSDTEDDGEPTPILPSKPTHLAESRPRIEQNITFASQDWRFGPVRIEGVDMAPGSRPRGESSTGEGINAGLVPADIGGGRVTKARFEPIQSGGKNTEVGWGIVHLYRDGEESVGLGKEVMEGEGKAEECTTLCIPAVPSYLTPSDFLGFVGERTREEVSHFRMVMTGRMNRYLVLMKFRRAVDARRWMEEWDGKVFSSMEPETCHVLFVKSITFQTPTTSSHTSTSYPALSHDPFATSSTSSSSLKPFPPPTPSLVELPTCPVCLERMDDTTGLLTILCQHVFHCACLQKWRGSGCPVCRHTNTSAPDSDFASPFGSGAASLCSICDCADDLWICLICGNVGCGRYKRGHAKEHWKESAHNFALEIETQHVWDYAGDLWVHRLIRGKGDGKVLEVGSQRQGIGGGAGHGEHDMEMVPRAKFENMGMEYTHLLTSQLESQRVYFEELVSKAATKASAASTAANEASQRASEALSRVDSLERENRRLRDETVTSLERELAREKRKAEKSAEVARGFSTSLLEEKRVGEGLMQRIAFLNRGMQEVTAEMGELRTANAELTETNRDLLFSISAQQKMRELEEEGGVERGELEGAGVSLPVERERKARKGKGKG